MTTTYIDLSPEQLLEKFQKANRRLDYSLQIEILKQAIDTNNPLILKDLTDNIGSYELTLAISFENLTDNNALYYSITKPNKDYFNYLSCLNINKNTYSNYLFHAIETNTPKEMIQQCIDHQLYNIKYITKKLMEYYAEDSFVNEIYSPIKNPFVGKIIKQQQFIPVMINCYRNLENLSETMKKFPEVRRFHHSLVHMSDYQKMASLFKFPKTALEDKNDIHLTGMPPHMLEESRLYVIHLLKDLLNKNIESGQKLLKYCVHNLCNNERENGKKLFSEFMTMLPEHKNLLVDSLISSKPWVIEFNRDKLEATLTNKEVQSIKRMKI